jgi:sugar phosphate isomerase/epimerase
MRATRREFGAVMAGAATAAVWPRPAAGQGQRIPPSVVGGILVGVATYTYRTFTFERMIASLRSVGISSLEIWGDGEAHPLHPMRQSEADFKRVRQQLDAAGTLLGARVLTTSCEKPILDRLDAAARKHKMKVGLHNHWNGDSWFVASKKDPKANFEGPADWEEAMKGRSEYMAINLDIGHFAAAGHDPVTFFKKNQSRIVSIHVKDRGSDPERSYVRFGKGATPITEFCRALKEARFPYAANIEYEIDEKEPTEGIREAYAYVRQALA